MIWVNVYRILSELSKRNIIYLDIIFVKKLNLY